MKGFKFLSIAAAAALTAATAYAQEEMGDEEFVGEIQTEQPDLRDAEGPYHSALRVTPQAGVFGYEDSEGDYSSRISEGATLTWDAGGMFDDMIAEGVSLGLQTGAIYSHVGAPDSNFFGGSSDLEIDRGANVVLIPLEAMVGYNLTDKLNISGLLGASGIYRSDTDAVNLGRREAELGDDDSFEVFPSLGLNVGYGLTDTVGLTLAGSYIPTPGPDVFTTTLGATIALVN